MTPHQITAGAYFVRGKLIWKTMLEKVALLALEEEGRIEVDVPAESISNGRKVIDRMD